MFMFELLFSVVSSTKHIMLFDMSTRRHIRNCAKFTLNVSLSAESLRYKGDVVRYERGWLGFKLFVRTTE